MSGLCTVVSEFLAVPFAKISYGCFLVTEKTLLWELFHVVVRVYQKYDLLGSVRRATVCAKMPHIPCLKCDLVVSRG